MASACHEDISDRMDYIKYIGNSDAKLAMRMLDSLECDVKKLDEPLRYKLYLLKVRFSDKADIMPTSDLNICRILSYYEKNGSALEKQEAYYYAGSVYRDLQDAPRALENFYQSIMWAEEAGSTCDSLMLRNTYSNLNYQYGLVQDYSNAAAMAHKEVELSLALSEDPVVAYMHLANAQISNDDPQIPLLPLNSAFDYICKSNNIDNYRERLYYIMFYYLQLNMPQMAEKCRLLINEDLQDSRHPFYQLAMAKFYETTGDTLSAIKQYRILFDTDTEISYSYECAKHLFSLYHSLGETSYAIQYADIYMSLSDSLDFGKRQLLAATVSNQYKYNLDKRREDRIKEDKQRYLYVLWAVSLLSVIIISAIVSFYLYNRNKTFRKITKLSDELKSIAAHAKNLDTEVQNKQNEVLRSTMKIKQNEEELEAVKRKLSDVSVQLEWYNRELEEKERLLAEKLDQNRTLLGLLHKTELESQAEDVIHTIRQSSRGIKNMSTTDWKQLYNAIDEMYPEFKSLLVDRLGTFTEQEMQVCYLLKINLAKQEIQNMTNLSRVTIWRWTKKFSWIHEAKKYL